MVRIGLTGASGLTLALALAATESVSAQTVPEPVGESATQAEASADNSEIVVTARRISEKAHDVPAAITAISGGDLDRLLVDDAASLIRQVPGATLVTSGPDFIADFSLRGQGGGRIGSSESATGLYRDGHYAAGGEFGGRTLNKLDLFDLQRIEVLRGPQGALYGRNAVGGSVNAIARKPSFGGVNGWAKVGYDSFDTVELEGAINLPLVENTLAARVAGYVADQNGGYVTNLMTGNKVDQKSSTGLRAALAWKPTSTVETRITFENFYNRTPAFGSLGYRATLSSGAPADPSIFERKLATESYARIKQQAVYWDTTIVAGYGDWHFNLDYRHRTGKRLDEDFSHFLGFGGVTLGGVLVELFNNEIGEFENGGAQIYLSSPASADRLNWLIGVDGLTNRSRDRTFVVGNATPAGLRAQFRDDSSTEKLRSAAIYGTLGYDVTDHLNVSGELRVQNDRKSIDFDRVRSTSNSTAVPFSVEFERNWTKVLPTATVRYAFNEQQNIYARFATGYRPGGFNTGIPADFPNAEKLIPYDPEYVYGGEVGWKALFLDGAWSINLAAYYTHTNNVQVVTAVSPTNPQFILQNAGDNHVYGFELESRGRIELGFGRLDISAAISTNDGKFDKGTSVLSNTGTVVDISGLRVNRTRNLEAAAGAVLNVPLSERVVASLGANLQSERGGYFNATNVDKLSNFTLLDLTAALAFDRWKLAAYIKNVDDRIYLLQTVSNNRYYNAPREYGGSLRVTF
jgi:outer membrane receptor protein involved in Fe transport